MKKTSANSTFTIGEVLALFDTFVVKGSSLFRLKLSSKSPAHCKSANCQAMKNSKVCVLNIIDLITVYNFPLSWRKL